MIQLCGIISQTSIGLAARHRQIAGPNPVVLSLAIESNPDIVRPMYGTLDALDFADFSREVWVTFRAPLLDERRELNDEAHAILWRSLGRLLGMT